MQGAKGIPIPDEIEVDGYTCVTIYVPNDSEGRYLEAMGGALSQMGKWNYWEKDNQKRGARVAEIWREHIDLTMETAWLSGVFMTCTQLDLLIETMIDNSNQLTSAIRALEFSTVNIDCIPCEDRVHTIPPISNDPDPNNPPIGNDETEWNEYLCRATNYLWYDHVMRGGAESVLLATTGAGIVSTGAILAILYASGIGAPIAFVGTIITAVIAIAIIYDETTLEDELERLAGPMICAIYSATGAQSALQAMRDTMVAEGAEQDLIDWVMAITGTNALNKLFDGEIVVPDEFIAPVSCSGCGDDMPELPEGWYWVSNIVTAVVTLAEGGSTEVTHLMNGNEANILAGSGIAYNSSGWTVRVDYDNGASVDEYMGMLFDINSIPSAGANTGGWLDGEKMLMYGDGSTGNIAPLAAGSIYNRMLAKNVNNGTHEKSVLDGLIASLSGAYVGNPNAQRSYDFALNYYHPWTTIENNVKIKTWSLYWDGIDHGI